MITYTRQLHTKQNKNPTSTEGAPSPDQKQTPCRRRPHKLHLKTPPHHHPRPPTTHITAHTKSKLAPARDCTITNTNSQWPNTAEHSPHTHTRIRQGKHLLNPLPSPPKSTHHPSLSHKHSEHSSHRHHPSTLSTYASLTHSPPKDTHSHTYSVATLARPLNNLTNFQF